MRYLSFKNLVILYLAGFLLIAPQIFAENESMFEKKSEKESDNLSETNNNLSESKPNDSSIKKKMLKSIKETIMPYREQLRRENRLNKKVNNPSLKVIVKKIYGDEENRSADIEFEGKEITVVKDQFVEGKFKIVDIYPDRMVVYDNAAQRRHTYKIIDNNLISEKEADISKEKIEPRPQMTNSIKKPDQSDTSSKLIVIVKEIIDEEGSLSAVIEFEGKEIKVAVGQIVNGKFKVVKIYHDRIVVSSNKEGRRQTYKKKEEGN